MTTYTYDGYYLVFGDDTDDAITLDPVQISLVTRPGPGVLTYQFDGPPRDDGLRPIDDINDVTYTSLVDGTPLSDATPYIARLTWGANNETFLLIFDTGEDEYIFVLGGDTLPFDTLAEFNDFNDNQITGAFNVTSGPFAPGQPIDLATLPGVTTTEDDLIFGTVGNDDLRGGVGSDTVNAGDGNDTVLGDDGNDEIFGQGGNDSLEGGASDDTIYGGGGSDVIDGGPGEDLIFGENGNDTINPGANPGGGGDFILPGLGNDEVIFSDVTDPLHFVTLAHLDLGSGITAFIDGGANTGRVEKSVGTTTLVDVNTAMSGDGMTIVGTSSNDAFNITPLPDGFLSIASTEGDDTINVSGGVGRVRVDYSNAPIGIIADLEDGTVEDGLGGIDTVTYGDGQLELRATMMADNILGSDVGERFILQGGNDTLDAGDGYDELRYDRSGVAALIVDLQAGTATGTWDGVAFTHTISNIEEVRGTRDGDDLMIGNDAVDNWLEGYGGDDTLDGGSGNDTIDGGDGNDTGVIGVGLDQITSATQNPDGSITVVSTQGTDRFIDIEFYDLNGVIVTDTALLNGPFSTTPTSGDDIITGDGGNDRVDAGDGNDTVNGGDGNDGLKGRDGDDLLIGGPGDDRLPGEGGNDTIIGGDGNDRLGGGDGNDLMIGGNGNDGGGAGPGNDTVFGGDGNDVFNGGYGSDYIDLGAGDDRSGASFGNDTVFGGDGNDLLTGGDGDDLIFGEAGDDTINSGLGEDTVTGGDGADLFIFNALFGGGTTVITDFEDGLDIMRVTGLRNPPDPLGRLGIEDTTYEGEGAASFTYGDHRVIVVGVSAADLTEADFLFA